MVLFVILLFMAGPLLLVHLGVAMGGRWSTSSQRNSVKVMSPDGKRWWDGVTWQPAASAGGQWRPTVE